MPGMNIFEALRVSHETQRALSARLLASEPGTPERRRVFLDLKRELLAHETAEERCFYVPLFEHDATVDAARHGVAEHHEMDEMVEGLEEQELNSPGWMAGAKKLCEKIEHHLKEEETKFFQEAGKVLSDQQKVSPCEGL
jgi:hypothetical protein